MRSEVNIMASGALAVILLWLIVTAWVACTDVTAEKQIVHGTADNVQDMLRACSRFNRVILDRIVSASLWG